MNQAHSLWIDGIALWTPQAPGWEPAAAALRGAALPDAPPATRPAAAGLASNERRRAPDSVLLALEVASAALADSGHDPVTTPSVFTSAHGDLPTTDALCRSLAADPLRLSPTRFHHSVHNAASGYWAIASGSTASSTALSAADASFAAGWLEAASLCAGERLPVLLVGFDTEAVGALTSVNSSRGLLAVALVLAPQRTAASRWQVDWRLDTEAPVPPRLRSRLAQGLADNAQSDALPLFEALALGEASALALRLSPALSLCLQLLPSASNAPAGA